MQQVIIPIFSTIALVTIAGSVVAAPTDKEVIVINAADNPVRVQGSVNVANTAADPVPVMSVNPTDQYFAIGATSQETTGAPGPGYDGIGAMNKLCQEAFSDDFPLARMCTTVEASNTPHIATVLNSGLAWVRPVVASRETILDSSSGEYVAFTYDQAGVVISATGGSIFAAHDRASPNCTNWVNSAFEWKGTAISAAGNLTYWSCADSLSVLCCAPLPLPAYQDYTTR